MKSVAKENLNNTIGNTHAIDIRQVKTDYTIPENKHLL